MPMVINGDGTITGLTAGGLPDATITSAEIAANAITSTLIADAAVTYEPHRPTVTEAATATAAVK